MKDAEIVTETRLKKFHKFLQQTVRRNKRYAVLYGGAGSGKTHSLIQHLCYLFTQGEDIQLLVTRKTFPALRDTCFRPIKKTLDKWGVDYELNKTEMFMEYNNNEIYFKSLDDREKIKSFNLTHIWIEEATELDLDDFRQLDLRLRARSSTHPNQIYLSFNPIDAYHWCITEMVERENVDEEIAVLQSTYKDNPFLDKYYTKTLEKLEQQNYNLYRVYALGLPGVLENVIYAKWKEVSPTIWPENVKNRYPDFYGVDWGYNDPTVLLAFWVYKDQYFIKELFYKTKYTTKEFADWCEKNGVVQGIKMYADPSRPDVIDEFRRRGFAMAEAERSILPGINFVKSQQLYVDPDAINWIKEARAYCYKKDKSGRVKEEPTEYNDHAMDAMRYAIYTNGYHHSLGASQRYEDLHPHHHQPEMYDGYGIPSLTGYQ